MRNCTRILVFLAAVVGATVYLAGQTPQTKTPNAILISKAMPAPAWATLER